LKKALELNADFPEVYLELGKIHFADKEYQQAIRAYERAIQLNPAFVEAYYRLSQAHTKVGNEEKAQEAAELAIKRQKELEADVARREKQILRFIYTLK
jgi:tetratricopeptide (TPR) repeat protein